MTQALTHPMPDLPRYPGEMRAGRAICRERCAAKGEPPCYRPDIGTYPAPDCDCPTLAWAALHAVLGQPSAALAPPLPGVADEGEP